MKTLACIATLSLLASFGCAANQARMKAGGVAAAAGFGAVAAASLVQAALGKKTAHPDVPPPQWPPTAVTTNVKGAPPAEAPPANVVGAPGGGRCMPPAPPTHSGCVSYVAEPHLDAPTCLYFCVEHCVYHAPGR